MVGITLSNLTRKFGATKAVDNVSLSIQQGELFFLLGPSGCGKTTLMRMVAGLIEPSEGKIHFDNRDVTRLESSRRNTALVFQGYALWPHMTVEQNISFGLEARKIGVNERRRRVEKILETVRMTNFARRRPNQLSGGQQQRVALARALVVEPNVLLLDEPLSNLDANLRTEMRGEIRRICRETQVTAIYVTHDQSEAMSIADRIAVMSEGRILQIGTAREIYERPEFRFVAEFLGKANFMPAVVKDAHDGEIRLETAAGELRSRVFRADMPRGGNVTCVLRPEAVRFVVDDERDDPPNIVEAKHVESIYFGHLAEHIFDVEGGLQFRVEELKPAKRQWNGETIRLGFDSNDLVVLSD